MPGVLLHVKEADRVPPATCPSWSIPSLWLHMRGSNAPIPPPALGNERRPRERVKWTERLYTRCDRIPAGCPCKELACVVYGSPNARCFAGRLKRAVGPPQKAGELLALTNTRRKGTAQHIDRRLDKGQPIAAFKADALTK